MMIKVITYLLLMQKVDGISVSDSLDGLKKVQPVIGSDIFDVVVDYGAVGDGKTDDTDALQAALDDCAASRNGGGIIKLLKGYEFLSLPLTLSGSGCALKIEGKLTQKFWQPSMSQGDIPEAFITVSDGVSDFLIYGGGIINGNGPTWWNSSGDTYANRPKLLDAKATNVALYDIQFYNSANHNLEMYCDNTEIAFVNITVDWDINDGDAPNTDGEICPCIFSSTFLRHRCTWGSILYS
uniref:Rhamnogalacturonase A/B/Epimerase-like pectate lyase domain-containing protein n=1 Tax=Aureoumbra lagunensis TaxID=44058 RepID=A0A7S3JUS8_9STRA|mmetsp:Transcript_10454/g.14441  ORF Transcript_10454/g.14441 Transcript_10454/m.14441 type:complete len:239 (-) Transcript_10454:927-1643(-)